jgi:hypothetical protein
VITFAGSRLRLTAVRRTLVEWRATSANASLATLSEGASGAELARPISHCDSTARLELSASLSAFDDGNLRDFSEPESCLPLSPLPRCWTRKRIPGSAVMQGNAPCAELVDARGLFARLVLHQVRPKHRSPLADAGPQNHSSHDPKPGAPSVPVVDIGSLFALGSAKRSPIPSSHPLPTQLETLFSELARRRVRKLAIREKP